MGLIDFILNLAGLLLWLNWRAGKADPIGKPTPATLIGTLRRAEPTQCEALAFASGAGRAVTVTRIVLLANRLGGGLGRKTGFGRRGNSFSQQFIRPDACCFPFSVSHGCSESFYLWLVLLSILGGPMPMHRLVRMQLGQIDGWPRWIKILLPLAVIALVWWLASWPFAWLESSPRPVSVAHRLGESWSSHWAVISSGNF